MTFYLIPFIFLTILTSLESKNKLNFLTQNRLIYYLIALFFIIFIGLRYEIGCDWEQYKVMFEKIDSKNNFDILKNFIRVDNFSRLPELGHILITKISQNIYILNSIYAILFSLPLFYFCSKLKRKYFSLLISYPYYVIVVGMGPIRQAACISFLMLSILFISNKKYYSHFFISIISILIHQSSIIFNSLILGSLLTKFRSIKFSKLNTFLIILALIVFLFCLPSTINKIYLYFTLYKKINSSNGIMYLPPAKSAILLWIMNLVPSLIFLTNKKNFNINYNLKNIFTLFSIIEILLLPIILIQSVIGYRFLLYLFPNSIYITSLIPDLNILKIKKIYIVNFLIFIAFITLITWLKFAYHSSCWVPYKNILFN